MVGHLITSLEEQWVIKF